MMTSSMSDEFAAEFRAQNDLVVAGVPDPPKPGLTFKEAGLDPDFVGQLSKVGFNKPTPLQAQCFPVVFGGRDLVGISHSGSGKTLTYLFPACVTVRSLRQNPSPGVGPYVLIVTSNADLALHVHYQTSLFSILSQLKIFCYQVEGMASHTNFLRTEAEVVITTGADLIHMMAHDLLSLERIAFIAIDEIDKLFAAGFDEELRRLFMISGPPPQVVLWSATWPTELQNFVVDCLQPDFVHITHGRYLRNISDRTLLPI
ncbi:ATP-dependent RNA helicase dbp2 [Blyttiomyces sp. JEL0837]|nr:ATP-dependent RNA helicase dbp2 [Blyttiomyces sp. JEL0837]